MPPRRANRRNVNASNANATPLVPDQEVSNVEFRNAIQMLAKSITNRNKWINALMIENGLSAAARV